MLIPLKFVLRAVLVILFTAAFYYRFVHYNALKFSLLFGAWLLVQATDFWLYRQRLK